VKENKERIFEKLGVNQKKKQVAERSMYVR
jgi:hypothetical protein